MSTYYCFHCDRYLDDDYHPGLPDVDKSSPKFSLVCPPCSEKFYDEDGDLLPEYREIDSNRVSAALMDVMDFDAYFKKGAKG